MHQMIGTLLDSQSRIHAMERNSDAKLVGLALTHGIGQMANYYNTQVNYQAEEFTDA